MADGLSDFAGSLDIPTGDYSLGADTSFKLPDALNVPAPIDIPAPTPFYEKALDFAGNLGAGIGKAFQASPLEAFSKTLGLGATGFGIANQLRTAGLLNQQTNQIQKSTKAAEAAAAPAVAFGTETLNQASAGKLPVAMEAAIEQWTRQAKADMRARLAALGLGNSTDVQGEDEKIDLMAQSMRGQLLQSQEGVAFQGLETGVSAATGGGHIAQNQQALLANLLEGANAQLAKLSATA